MTTSLSDKQHAYEPSTAKSIYVHRQKCGGGWGVFTVHESGLVQCYTDHGNYQHWWKPGTETMAEFLIGCDPEYIMMKFSKGEEGGKHLYADDTVEAMKNDILKYRREYGLNPLPSHPGLFTDGFFTKEQARECWEELSDLDDYRTAEGFSVAINHKPYLTNMYEEYGGGITEVPVLTGPSYELKAMMKTLWPSFIEALKLEIMKAKGEGHR